MKKYFIYFCIISIMINTNAATENNNFTETKIYKSPKYQQNDYKTCEELFIEYNIDPEIRSAKGWYRIYKSNTLLDYLKITNLKTNDKKLLINCLVGYAFKIKIKENYENKNK